MLKECQKITKLKKDGKTSPFFDPGLTYNIPWPFCLSLIFFLPSLEKYAATHKICAHITC